MRPAPLQESHAIRLRVCGACLGLAVLTGAAGAAAPGAAAADGRLRNVVSGKLRMVHLARLRSSTSVTAPRLDRRRVFVTTQEGRAWVVRDGRLLRRPFLDLRGKVFTRGGEAGFLSIAFHPDYARNRLFYAFYSSLKKDIEVREFRRSRGDPDRAIPRGRLVLTQRHRKNPGYHWGGQLQFGPDGYLYIGIGDGTKLPTDPGTGQNLRSLNAKVLRIDPRPARGRPYSVPADNPFVGRPDARPETWAWGLRNPWRFSFDRLTGQLVIADVGQAVAEEINYLPFNGGRAANLGWCTYEGTKPLCFREGDPDVPGYVDPVHTLSHDKGFCAVIGGYVVRDRTLKGLYGRYLYSDYCRSRLRTIRLSYPRATGDRELKLGAPFITTFGEDARGRIYVASQQEGLYRLAPR